MYRVKKMNVFGVKEGTKAIRHEGNKVVKKSALVKSCGNCLTLKNLSPYCPSALSWICSTLGKFRLCAYSAQPAQFPRYPDYSLRSMRPSANPLVPLKRTAFTMVEILISLTIIGIIAAITLPSLVGSINEKTFSAKRKALYSRMSQAISMMPSLNGYGSGSTIQEINSHAAENFLSNGLAKVLEVNNICDVNNLSKCNIPSKIKTVEGSALNVDDINTVGKYNDMFYSNASIYYHINLANTTVAALETRNGESLLTYYNRYCISDSDITTYQTEKIMCVNFIYDLNGRKGPNTVGKDIGFITAFQAVDPIVVAPMPVKVGNNTLFSNSEPYSNARQICKNTNTGYRLPNIEEWMSLYFNRKLSYGETGVSWSNTPVANSVNTFWIMNAKFGQLSFASTSKNHVRCVKR